MSKLVSLIRLQGMSKNEYKDNEVLVLFSQAVALFVFIVLMITLSLNFLVYFK